MTQVVFKETLRANLSSIEIKAGQLIYCIDNNETYYDVNSTLRSLVTKVVYLATEVDRLKITSPSTKIIYMVRQTLSVYLYTNNNEWKLVEDASEIQEIFNLYTTLHIGTINKNGENVAPRGLARAIYTDAGETVEDRLKFITKVGTSTIHVVATSDKQRIFDVPFPFNDYMQLGNSVIVSSGSTIFDHRRYSIQGNKLILNQDEAGIAIGRSLTFLFIYNSSLPLANVLTAMDGKFIIDGTIGANKLEKISNSINTPDPSSVASSLAVNNLKNFVVDYVDNLAHQSGYFCTATQKTKTAEAQDDFVITASGVKLTQGFHIYMRLTELLRVTTFSGYRVNFNGKKLMIYEYPGYLWKPDSEDDLMQINMVYDADGDCFYNTYSRDTVINVSSDKIIATEGQTVFDLDTLSIDSDEFSSLIDTINVYQEGVKLHRGINYDFDPIKNTIKLKDYSAEAGEIFVFECINLKRAFM